MKNKPQDMVQPSEEITHHKPPKVSEAKLENGVFATQVIVSSNQEEDIFLQKMSQAFGIEDEELQSYLISQGMRIFPVRKGSICVWSI